MLFAGTAKFWDSFLTGLDKDVAKATHQDVFTMGPIIANHTPNLAIVHIESWETLVFPGHHRTAEDSVDDVAELALIFSAERIPRKSSHERKNSFLRRDHG